MSAKEGPASPVVLAGRDQWREWLCTNEDSSDGIWLMLAKKRVTTPTSLSYGEALDEALCSGWIDGQRNGYDERTYLQRFTPRRARSLWSRRNVEIAERLAADGRLRPRGIAEIERARSDGRWDRAYPGQATAQPPDALRTALEAAPAAKAAFSQLTRPERFIALLPLLTATNEETPSAHGQPRQHERVQKALAQASSRRPDARAARAHRSLRLVSRADKPRLAGSP